MVSKQVIKVIIQAEETISKTAKQAEKAIKNMGTTSSSSMGAISNASKKANSVMQKMSSYVNTARQKFDSLKRTGSSMGSTVKQGISQAANSFGQLITNSNTAKLAMEKIKGVSNTVGRGISNLKNPIMNLGSSFNNLGNKISNFGSNVKTRLSSAFKGGVESAKASLTGLSGKIDSLKAKLNQLKSSSKSASGGLGFLSTAASMTVGMIGYDLVNSMAQSARESINASGNFKAFGKRMKMSSSEMGTFSKSVDKMQEQFRKVDMKAVGASALEMGVKLKLPKNSMEDLTKTTAVMSSAFVKEGRTQEDAILAVSDAMDGQFRRLQELGISQDALKNNGWDGDLNNKKGLLEAMNKTLDEMGFTETAKQINTLDDAYQAITVSGGQLLAEILIPLTPIFVSMADAFYYAVIKAKEFIKGIGDAWNGLPDWTKKITIIAGLSAAFVGLGIVIIGSVIPAIVAGVSSFVAYIAGAVGVEIANMGLAASFLAVATAILANPLTWVVVALVALAVAVYEVGKSFGWWSDVGSMLEAIKNNIGRLWDAFIHHPDVQALVKGIGDAWKWLNTVLKPVVDWLKGMWDKMFPASAKGKVDGTRMIIDAIGSAFKILVAPIKMVISALQTLYNFALPIGQGIYNALKPIVCIFLGCSPGIVPALQKVQEVFTTVWNAIVGFIGGVVSSVVSAIQPLIDVLSLISSVYLTAFSTAWNIVVSTFSIVWNSINRIISIFNLFVGGQISLTQALSMVWSTIRGMFVAIFANIIGHVVGWASSIVNKAKEAGRGFFNGVINFIKRLPGGIGTYLVSVISRIASAGRQWINTGRQKAQNLVTAVIAYIKQLPGKVYNEFASIPGKIRDAALNAVNAAKDFGKKIMDAVLNTLGIHSPGIIQNKLKDEFKNTVGKITDNVKPAGEAAKQLGDSILDNFGTPELSVGTDDLLNEDALKTSIGVQAELVSDLDAPKMNTNLLTGGLSEVSTLTNSSNADIAGSYQKLTTQMSNSLNSMVNTDKLAYNSIRSNDAIQMSNISSNLTNKMNQMSNTMRTSMDNIVNKNKTGMVAAKNNTKNQLDLMLSKTKSANAKMVQSWLNMTNKIVSAANKIKTDSTSHFKKLETTIGGFYRKLQNPGSFGAGPGGHVSSRKPYGGNGFRKIKNIVRQYSLPQYLTSGEVRRNPLITNTNMGDYITPDNTRFSTADLIRAGNIKIPLNLEDIKNKGAGWLDAVPPHVRKIKETSNKWSMKGPKIIGKYQTNTGFKVSDFINGTPKIDFATFKSMAEDVFSQCHYDFYYDSNKYGSWQNAFQGGYMNCSDSSDALIAFAHACGLSASKVHGHWNNVGHFWAEVEGHKMDTTGWMNQRNWTPSASHAGPAPKSMSFEGFINELKDASSNEVIIEKDNNNNETVTVDGEFTIVHDFINLPDGVSADEVANIVSKTTADENWIKKLVQNIRFQKHDLKEKTRLKAKKSRAIGV